MKKLKVTLEDRPVDVELAQYKRMFEAACSSLAAIGDALGVEPEEGGAEPILSAIAELKNSPVQQAEQEPVGEALQIASVALQDIACSSQTENLYWWQLRARKAQKQIAECLTNAAPVKPVKQEPFGYYVVDDPKVFAMPGAGFHVGKEPPLDCLHVTPLYAAPVRPVKQEPVAFIENGIFKFNIPSVHSSVEKGLLTGKHELYAAPVSAKREWVELTDYEIGAVMDFGYATDSELENARDVIAAFKEKNK